MRERRFHWKERFEEVPNFFFSEKLAPILAFPVQKLSMPKHYSDKVELDRIPTLPYSPYMPFILTDQESGRDYIHVFGYREIFLKRQRIRLLRLEAGLPECPDEEEIYGKGGGSRTETGFEAVAPGGGKGEGPKKALGKKKLGLKGKGAKGKKKAKAAGGEASGGSDEDDDDEPDDDEDIDADSTWGKDWGDDDDDDEEDPLGRPTKPPPPTPSDSEQTTATPKKTVGKKKLGKKKGKFKTTGAGLKAKQKHKDFKKLLNLRKKTRKKAKKKGATKKGGDGEGGEVIAAGEAIDDDLGDQEARALDREIEEELDHIEADRQTTIDFDPDEIEMPVLHQDFLVSNVPETEDEYKSFLVAALEAADFGREDLPETSMPSRLGDPKERDNEWLQLSKSNSLEFKDRKEADRLYKQKLPWMIHGISFESQELISKMGLFFKSSLLSGRSPYLVKPNFQFKVIELVLNRKVEVLFLFTSVVLWLVFVLLVQATIDIQILAGGDENSEKEKNDVETHFVFLFYFIGELAVVATWSVLMLLNYALRVAHYFNLWSVALTEMETNAGKGVFSVTLFHHLTFFVYCFVLILSFGLKTPSNVRGSAGLLTGLIARNFVPDIIYGEPDKTKKGNPKLILQITGLCIHLYITYCVRIIYNLMHIPCVVLKNAAEMWNLKFALRMSQIPIGSSGYLRQLKIRQTLVKMWLHHRLLTGLCAQLGDIFALPITMLFLTQLAIVTWCMVQLFKDAYISFYTKETHIEELALTTDSLENYPTSLENIICLIFVVAYFVHDFVVNASFLALASQAYRDGFEFVRRKGLSLCQSSHERRVVQSLQWSFSSTNPQEVNLLGFFPVNRVTMLGYLATCLLLWSLIIQLQAEQKAVIVVFTPNCSQEPVGRFQQTHPVKYKSYGNFCRKKVWILASQLNKRVQVITTLKITDDLTKQKPTRRRRDIYDTVGDITRSPIRMEPIHWLASKTFQQHQYFEGNCLWPHRPMTEEEQVTNYFLYFHEPCFSQVLNMTLMVPKLFDALEKSVWAGRHAIDCGVFPFTPFPMSLFQEDCSFNKKFHEYDDCGWRKTPVDDFYLGHLNGNNGTVGKIPFQTRFGPIHCWNIFSALLRCERIVKLKLEHICYFRVVPAPNAYYGYFAK